MIPAVDLLLLVVCSLTMVFYKNSNPYLEIERDLYDNHHRCWYYSFKYSRIIVFAVVTYGLYMVAWDLIRSKLPK